MVEAGDSSFGAPVLSASTNGEAVVEDPTYNPAKGPETVTTPVVTRAEKTISITDDIEISEAAGTSLIIVLVIVVLIVGCCFGSGTLLICFASITKASQQIYEVQKKHAQAQ